MKNSQKKIKAIAFSGVLSAFAILILFAGSIFDVASLSVGAIASMVVLLVLIELGTPYALGVYFTVSILSILLLPTKSPSLFFAFFFGFFPILKVRAERLSNRLLAYGIKIAVFHIAVALYYLVLKFFIPSEMETLPMMIVLYVLALVAFVLFDFALSKLTTAYFLRWREQLKIYKLLK